MFIIKETLKVAYGLVIIGVCVIGLIVISKQDDRTRRKHERLQRSYLRLGSHRNTFDD